MTETAAPSSKPLEQRLPSMREAAAVFAILAVAGFLGISRYYPEPGVIWNVMNGYIVVDGDCGVLGLRSDACTAFEYRHLLMLLVAAFGFYVVSLLYIRRQSAPPT